jgi:hypothetical protein
LDKTSKAQEITENKKTSSQPTKYTINRKNNQTPKWNKILTNYISAKGTACRIYEDQYLWLQTATTKVHQFQKQSNKTIMINDKDKSNNQLGLWQMAVASDIQEA